jgi:anti-sigma factor RsiW
MACDEWKEKLDAYLDDELAAGDVRLLEEHLRRCAACAAESLGKLRLKRAIQAAGQRYIPDAAYRARMEKNLAQRSSFASNRLWFPSLASAAAVLIVSAIALSITYDRRNEQQLLSEVVDVHVATLASSNPVDVVSTDRHTVKPWFEGKIPFTFNLPELQNSPFVLVGGRVTYLHQSPGAELIFRMRQHQISAFIFQQKLSEDMPGKDFTQSAESFNVQSWSHNGLRYFVVGDVAVSDLEKLSELLKAAG